MAFIHVCMWEYSVVGHTHTHTLAHVGGGESVIMYWVDVCAMLAVSADVERTSLFVFLSVCVWVCMCVFVCGGLCLHNTISIQLMVSTVATLAWCGQAHLMSIILTYFTAYSNILILGFPFKLQITVFMCFLLLCLPVDFLLYEVVWGVKFIFCFSYKTAITKAQKYTW